jgi:hypothetical protein
MRRGRCCWSRRGRRGARRTKRRPWRCVLGRTRRRRRRRRWWWSSETRSSVRAAPAPQPASVPATPLPTPGPAHVRRLRSEPVHRLRRRPLLPADAAPPVPKRRHAGTVRHVLPERLHRPVSAHDAPIRPHGWRQRASEQLFAPVAAVSGPQQPLPAAAGPAGSPYSFVDTLVASTCGTARTRNRHHAATHTSSVAASSSGTASTRATSSSASRRCCHQQPRSCRCSPCASHHCCYSDYPGCQCRSCPCRGARACAVVQGTLPATSESRYSDWIAFYFTLSRLPC